MQRDTLLKALFSRIFGPARGVRVRPLRRIAFRLTAISSALVMVLSGLYFTAPANASGVPKQESSVSARQQSLTRPAPVNKKNRFRQRVIKEFGSATCIKGKASSGKLPSGRTWTFTPTCLKLDTARLGRAGGRSAGRSRNDMVGPKVGAVNNLTPLSICPSAPNSNLAYDRFDLCIYSPLTQTGTLQEGPDTYIITVTFNVEMWAELDNQARTWTTDAIITPTSISNRSGVTLDAEVGLGCTDSGCTTAPDGGTPASGVLGAIAVNSPLSAQFGVDDTANSATVRLNNVFQIVFLPDPGSGVPCIINCQPQNVLWFGSQQSDPIRCDSNVLQTGFASGCAVPAYDPIWSVSNSIYPAMGLVAKHMAMATGNLNPPYPPLQGAGGQIPGVSDPLTYEPSREDANRAALCNRLTPPPQEAANGNTTCDEYPLAKTLQGAASGGPVSVCWVPSTANSSQGGVFSGFLASNRVLPDDDFYVNAHYTPTGRSPGCDDSGSSGGGGSGPAPTMMVVGDSISQGFEGDVTWRYDLANLESDVPGFQFVGPWSGTDSLPASLPAGWPTVPAPPIYNGAYSPGEVFPGNDSQHYAHWGRQMTEAATNIEATVAQYQPNYLLVELGFNDLAFGIQSPQGLLSTVQSFVSAARAANPSIRILFANVPQRSPLAIVPNLPSVISAYDQGLPSTLAGLSTAQSPVELVPFASGYDYTTDTYDGLHPDNIGEWVIADAFANALSSDFGVGGGSNYQPGGETVVPISNPATPTLTPNAAGIDVSWPHIFGAEGYNLEVANLTWGQTLGPSTELPLAVQADSWELGELIPGDTYEVAIQAIRGYQQSAWSGSAEATANPSTPAPPTALSVVPQSGGISMSWTTPTGQNDSNITGYQISWQDNTDPTASLHNTQVSGNSYEITDGDGISPGDMVDIAISAVNPSGAGYASGAVAIPDEGTPAAPTITSDKELDTNDDALTWTPGSSASTAGYYISGYGFPFPQLGQTLPDEFSSSTTSFTSGFLQGNAANVRMCVQAANGTLTSTLTLSGPDCALPAGQSASVAGGVPDLIHPGTAGNAIPLDRFSPRFRLMLEGVAGTALSGNKARAGVTSPGMTSSGGALVPAFAPDGVQALLGNPADLLVIVPSRK